MLTDDRIGGLGGVLAGASLLVLAMAAATPAQAQDKGPAVGAAPQSPAAAASTAATDNNAVGEVVVTAEFRRENVQQTPIAITAVSGQMLQNRGQTSIAQVANQAPNVTLKAQGNAFGPSLGASIRGVGQYDFDPALEPGVGMYVDDVYYPTLTGSILDLLDLDRVEILRGPQGTLAGQNSIGGAVKLYSKRPDANEGGYVEGSYGSLNHLEARGGIDFALVPDQLFVRLAAVTNHYDGYVTRYDYGCLFPGSGVPAMVGANRNCVTGKEGGKDYSAARVAVRYTPNDKLELNLIADYTYDSSENPATTLLHTAPLSAGGDALVSSAYGVSYGPQFIPANPYASYASYYMPAGSIGPFSSNALAATDRSQYKGWGVSGDINYRFNDTYSLRSITAFRGYTSDWSEDNDVSPLPLGLGIEHLAHQQVSEELRFNGGFGKLIDYTLGGFYFDEKTTYASHQNLWYPGIILDFLQDDPVDAQTKAVFGTANLHVTDKLTLRGGFRYTDQTKDYHYVRVNPDGSFNPIVGPLNGQTGNFSGTRWDWRADIDYQWTPNFMAYAEASTGFKGGGVNPRPFVVAQVQPFGPETLTAYEIGFKSQWLDHKVRLNVSAFWNDYNAIQLTLLSCPQFGGPGPCALPTNAGNAHVKGAEAETEIHPFGGLELDGSVSYLDFKYTSLAGYDPALGVSTTTGVSPSDVTPYTPKWKWSIGAQYSIPVGTLGELIPRVDLSYQGSVYSNALNGPLNYIPSYTVGNARLTWRNGKGDWEAAVEVSNFTNKLYYLTTFDLTGAGGGSVSAQPAMPREWSVSVMKRF
jgi:iron complex outermembrane receptor protein